MDVDCIEHVAISRMQLAKMGTSTYSQRFYLAGKMSKEFNARVRIAVTGGLYIIKHINK
jgi:hypothetical protein